MRMTTERIALSSNSASYFQFPQPAASLTTEQRTTLEKQLRQIFLSNRPDGRRSFVAAAWICKGIVPLEKG